jgi:hypothetical protein
LLARHARQVARVYPLRRHFTSPVFDAGMQPTEAACRCAAINSVLAGNVSRA